MHHPTIASALTAVLAVMPAAQAAGLYTKNSPVLQLDGRSYERHIAQSNYTSIVEFYAPWCGHCQNLKPAYEKAAKNLEGLAKVAAVNCDDDSNKNFCASLGVTGFPTLKIVRPGKKPGSRPVVEDYQGQRTANSIVEAVVSKINNHVTRLTDKDAVKFLSQTGPKAILFTEKGTTSALLRSVAIDFLGVISVAQVRNKETIFVEQFGVDKFPTLLLVPDEGEPIKYEGELNKKDIVAFLKQAGEPNPDPAPAKAKPAKANKAEKKKTEKKTEKKAEEKAEEATEKAEEAAPKAEPEEPVESATPEPSEEVTPEPEIIPIKSITSYPDLVSNCLHPRAQTCVLALVAQWESEKTAQAVFALSKLSTKYIHGKRHMFPFFSVPNFVEGVKEMRGALEISENVEIIALNARRGWWRHYDGDFTLDSIESWVDAMRMGEGEKKKLPKGIAHEEPTPSDFGAEEAAAPESAPVSEDEKVAEPAKEAEAKPESETEPEPTQATDPEPEVKTEEPEVQVEEPEVQTEEPVKEKVKHEEL